MRGAEKDGADRFADQRLAFGHVLWLPFPIGAPPRRRGGDPAQAAAEGAKARKPAPFNRTSIILQNVSKV
jgi:hypothetical protein